MTLAILVMALPQGSLRPSAVIGRMSVVNAEASDALVRREMSVTANDRVGSPSDTRRDGRANPGQRAATPGEHAGKRCPNCAGIQ